MTVSSAARFCSSASIAALWFLQPIFLLGIAVLVALLAFREYAGIAARAGAHVSRPAGGIAVALVCVAVAHSRACPSTRRSRVRRSDSRRSRSSTRGARRSPGGGALQSAAIAAFAPLYIGLPLGLLAATRWMLGREAALLLILTVAISDTLQYYSGRTFGRHLLAPVVSPKKTIEGAIGGFVGAALSLAVIGHWWLPQMGLPGARRSRARDRRGRHRRRSVRVAC